MATGTFDFAPLLPAGLPPAAARWTGLAKYSFVGGNNDPDQVPVVGLIDAVNAVLKREGSTLATYGTSRYFYTVGRRGLPIVSHQLQLTRSERLRHSMAGGVF